MSKEKIGINEEDELEEFFEKKKESIIELIIKKKNLYNSMNKWIYDIYGLNSEEIKLIEQDQTEE